jgi:phage I-like protein
MRVRPKGTAAAAPAPNAFASRRNRYYKGAMATAALSLPPLEKRNPSHRYPRAEHDGREVLVSTCAIALTSDEAPEWVELIPAGKFSAVDGRGPFDNSDPDQVVAASIAKMPQAGLVLDFDHSTDLAAPEGRPAPAAGWLKRFKVEHGAIFARIEWTSDAAGAVKAKKYRYVSPVFEHSKDGKVERILRAALTNNPALINLPALARAENPHLISPWSGGGIGVASLGSVMFPQGSGGTGKGERGHGDRDLLRPAPDQGEGRVGVSSGVFRMAREDGKKPKLSEVMASLEETYPGASAEELMKAAASIMTVDDGGEVSSASADDDPYEKETEAQMSARQAEEMARCVTEADRAECTKKHTDEKERFAARQVRGLQHQAQSGGRPVKDQDGTEAMSSKEDDKQRRLSYAIAKHPMVVKMANDLNQMLVAQAYKSAEAAVDSAIREGRLIPSQRDWAIEYCSGDPKGFQKFIGAQPRILQSGADGTFTGRMGEVKEEVLSAKELMVCQNLGLPAALAEYSVIAGDGTIQRLRKPDRFIEVFGAAKKARLSHNVHLD